MALPFLVSVSVFGFALIFGLACAVCFVTDRSSPSADLAADPDADASDVFGFAAAGACASASEEWGGSRRSRFATGWNTDSERVRLARILGPAFFSRSHARRGCAAADAAVNDDALAVTSSAADTLSPLAAVLLLLLLVATAAGVESAGVAVVVAEERLLDLEAMAAAYTSYGSSSEGTSRGCLLFRGRFATT